ncbi:hypothetical protein [Ferruginibacter sp.]
MKKITVVLLFMFAAFFTKAQVSKLVLSLDSVSNSGKCPHLLNFKLQVTCAAALTADIIWRKSDNSTQTVKSVALKSGINNFFYDWKISADMSGHISVLVNSSDHKESNQVSFKVTCK